MAHFAYGSGKTPNAYTVAAHDGKLFGIIGISIFHMHGLCIFGTQLEDVSYLYAPADLKTLLSAYGTYATFLNL